VAGSPVVSGGLHKAFFIKERFEVIVSKKCGNFQKCRGKLPRKFKGKVSLKKKVFCMFLKPRMIQNDSVC